jgi:predicted flap endonuclease-1-like 5' DNA nuclease
MDEEGVRRFLKSYGKKPHVVEGLIGQVRQFEEYLAQERRQGLEAAETSDLRDYLGALDAARAGDAGKKERGLALYYRFLGDTARASVAADFREKEIAKTRKVFPLKDFRGVGQNHVVKLAAVGIVNVEQMLEAGRTPEARQRLAEETGVPLEAILELVKLSDLARITALREVRARLYYDAGADTPEKIARWEPEDLRKMLAEFVARTGFAGIAPLPKEVLYTVTTARQLPRVVQY